MINNVYLKQVFQEEKVMTALLRKTFIFGLFCILSINTALADEVLMPFVLAFKTTGDVNTVAGDAKGKLTGAGFEVVGEYSPFAGTHIIGVNPIYMAAAYRMASDMADIRAALEGALGAEMDYGSEKNLTAEDLRKFHYTVMMEYFDDPSELAEYDNYAQAVKAVEDSLAAGLGATAKVWRVDIPGKDETVFGVALKGANDEDCSGDKFVMSRVDKATPRSSAHLPYEILVTGEDIEALYARFRIAINWPHLPMVASESGGTFFSIMCSPSAIEEALIQASGEQP
jgi:hypothetical protein